MSDFLTGGAISEAVQRTLGAPNVRCASAFWGGGAAEFMAAAGAALSDVRIVCDISMGATSPAALVALGAPENDQLREQSDFHAKVYISDHGAVVGSANMSANGLGFGGKAKLREAAVFLSPGSDAFIAATVWFEALYSGSGPVDRRALEYAEARYRPYHDMVPSVPVQKGSLLDLVVADPDAFNGVGFVFCKKDADEEEVELAKADMKGAYPAQAKTIGDWNGNRMFIGWSKNDIQRWPDVFVEYFRPKRRLHVSFHEREMRDRKHGHVFTVAGGRAIKAILAEAMPSRAAIEQADEALVNKLLAELPRKKAGLVFRSANELRHALLALQNS